MKNLTYARWPRLALGVLTLLFAGVIYAWSILKAPLAAAFAWTAPQLALNYTLTMCFFCLGGLLSGLLANKTTPRQRMLASAVLACSGFCGASFLDGSSLLPLYLCYGVLGGLGIGIVYNTVISVTYLWFPDKKGLCSGCLMMGFGLSSLVLGNITGRLLAAGVSWPAVYAGLGIAIGAVLCAAGLLLQAPPAGAELPAAPVKRGEAAAELPPREMLRRAAFWRLFFFLLLFVALGNTVISFAKDYALSTGAGEALAVLLVGVLSVCNGLGRLLSGALFDRAGMRPTLLATVGLGLCGSVLGLAAAMTRSLPLGVAAICLCGLTYGCCPTVTTTFVSAFFGSRHFTENFGILNLLIIPAAFAATLAGSLVQRTGGYASSFVLLIVLSLAGWAIGLRLLGRRKAV